MYSNYCVVHGESMTIAGALVELTREVRECMAHGWEPLGGAFWCGTNHYSDYSNAVYGQTLVKRIPEPVDDKRATC